jgi:hypothetical protein
MAKKENLADRTGTETLDFEDRRRVACSEFMLTWERNVAQDVHGVYPGQFGDIVLRWSLGMDEIVPFGDRMTEVLHKTLQGR